MVTLQYLWMIIMEYLFQYLGYCATFCIFYRVINWFIERIHKEGNLAHIVKVTHWVFFALMCSYTAVAWAVSIYFRVEFVESTDVDKINDWGNIFTYTMSAVEIIWWVASLEVCVWVGYAAFHVYRDQHRAARVGVKCSNNDLQSTNLGRRVLDSLDFSVPFYFSVSASCGPLSPSVITLFSRTTQVHGVGMGSSRLRFSNFFSPPPLTSAFY